jgi:hypothetical protein
VRISPKTRALKPEGRLESHFASATTGDLQDPASVRILPVSQRLSDPSTTRRRRRRDVPHLSLFAFGAGRQHRRSASAQRSASAVSHEDLARSQEIRLDEWRRRRTLVRLLERAAAMFAEQY